MNIKNIFNKLKNHRGYENNIKIDELNEIIKTNPNSILLDVRSPQEYKEEHLNRSNKYTII